MEKVDKSVPIENGEAPSTLIDGRAGGEEKESVKQSRCSRWMLRHRLGWLARLPGEWPRTFALIFGVILPLFLLILVSLFFGYGLAKLEAPSEKEANNAILANRALVQTANNYQGNVTQALPRICLEIIAENSTDTLNETMNEELDKIFLQVIDRTKRSNQTSFDDIIQLDLLLPNTTLELLTFMDKCGKTGVQISKRVLERTEADHDLIGADLTFDWIRCDSIGDNSSSSLLDQIWGRPYLNRTRLLPNVQAADAISRWRSHAVELYNETLEQILLDNGSSPLEARIEAYRYATENAHGFGHCYPNSAAGAWFWFTLETTIGYGNYTPETTGGRAMIYTLGFLSILLFAVILGTAGTVVVTIWDDFINRTKLHHFNTPWVACLFWGFCYYAWMLVIAAVTQNWKAARLGEEIEFSEAYWFSYISTTTVGFGDYYLESDVILRQDLITFPLLFLTGFVLLANFFVKLTEVLTNLIPRNKPTLEETLAESRVPCLPKPVKKGLKVITDIAHLPDRSSNTSPKAVENAEVSQKEVTDNAVDDAERATAVDSILLDVGDGWKGSISSKSSSPENAKPM